jgi:SHS2 domain-containing protein
MTYRFLEHAADVKFRAEGSTVEEMYISAAEALNETFRGDINILELEEKSFVVDGPDQEVLLYNFLEEFLFLLDAEEFLVSKIRSIEVGDGKISCVVSGDKAENYVFTNDVKAITYNEMVIGEGHGKYFCEVVLDV